MTWEGDIVHFPYDLTLRWPCALKMATQNVPPPSSEVSKSGKNVDGTICYQIGV